VLAVMVALGIVLVSQYLYAVYIPFINEDYIFLDRSRTASFGSLWGLQHLMFNWYRPWSREFHYWLVSHLFGPRELPFHLASWALWMASILAYFAYVRRLAGTATAGVAVAGLVAMAAWGVPLLWIAGVQDLWMLLFAMLALNAFARDRVGWTVALTALAFLSKETAVFLPPLLVLHGALIERRSWRDALIRTWAVWVVAIAWALVHPALGGRFWHHVTRTPIEAAHGPWWSAPARTALTLINLDFPPHPSYGWKVALLRASPAVIALVLLAAWAVRSREEAEPRPRGRVAVFGIGWALLGWAPLMMPSLRWHAYYSIAGALGAWLALALGLSRRRLLAPLVIMALVVLRSGLSDTPSLDWGTEWYQRRASEFLGFMRGDLMRKKPRPLPHSRLFFALVPNNVGFMSGDGPSLRVWYRDPTLSGGFFSAYTPRPPGPGTDYFFLYDSTAGFVEIVKGEEDLAAAQADPAWETNQQGLGALFERAQDWRASADVAAKLATARPSNADYAYRAGSAYAAAGDSAAAARWFARAAELPGAPADALVQARRYAGH
jgi:hypothetical protein